MKASRLLTLDSLVLIAAKKEDEPYSEECLQILSWVLDSFISAEPSIVYQEVCGTLARRIGRDEADQARRQRDSMTHPGLPVDRDKALCV
jgi:predicted nucleic acid-binding protein